MKQGSPSYAVSNQETIIAEETGIHASVRTAVIAGLHTILYTHVGIAHPLAPSSYSNLLGSGDYVVNNVEYWFLFRTVHKNER